MMISFNIWFYFFPFPPIDDQFIHYQDIPTDGAMQLEYVNLEFEPNLLIAADLTVSTSKFIYSASQKKRKPIIKSS